MRIYLVLLFYVGAVLCCKPEGAVMKLHVHCERTVCRHGKWVPEECTHDDDQYQSDLDTNDNTFIKCNEGKKYPDYVDKGVYYECSKRVLVLRRCPPGNRYDGYNKECVKKHEGDDEYQDYNFYIINQGGAGDPVLMARLTTRKKKRAFQPQRLLIKM
nr:uncharacterized protein LOC106678264 [Halyomorpha halys]